MAHVQRASSKARPPAEADTPSESPALCPWTGPSFLSKAFRRDIKAQNLHSNRASQRYQAALPEIEAQQDVKSEVKWTSASSSIGVGSGAELKQHAGRPAPTQEQRRGPGLTHTVSLRHGTASQSEGYGSERTRLQQIVRAWDRVWQEKRSIEDGKGKGCLLDSVLLIEQPQSTTCSMCLVSPT